MSESLPKWISPHHPARFDEISHLAVTGSLAILATLTLVAVEDPGSHTPRSRDSALRRLALSNRWMIAGSVALSGVLAEAAANAFPGKTINAGTQAAVTKTAAAREAARRRARQRGSSGSTSSLQAPAQAPQASPERNTEAAPERSSQAAPEQHPEPTPTPAPETHVDAPETHVEVPEQRSESAPTPEQRSDPAPERQAESIPTPAQVAPEAPVVSGGS
jgi:outer membrane biosynthesis protein TonB